MTSKVKKGFLYRLFSTDHRDVGNCYLGFAVFAGVVGAVFSILLRLGLNEAGVSYFNRFASFLYERSDTSELFLLLSTGHALIMFFFMMLPALLGGFANWMVPLLIGCDEVAFPKLNRFAFWLLASAFVLFFLPLFYRSPANFLIAIAAFHLCGVSLMITFINFIATIVTMRAPGMTLVKMPIFVWSVLISSFLGVMCLPAMLAATITPSFFVSHSAGHWPVMLWFLMHPESYMLLLPAFGIVSQIITTFTKRPLVAANGVVSAMIVIGFAGFILWTENLFHLPAGFALNNDVVAHYFKIALPLIGLPVSFILFSWVSTLLSGRISICTPLLWAIGFVVISVFGMFLTLMLTFSDYDSSSEKTPVFIVHFHYIISLSIVFAIFASWYFWFPKMTGFTIREVTGRLHFCLFFCAVNMIFAPQYFAQDAENSYSFAAFIDSFIGWNTVSSVGAWLAAGSLIVFLYGIVESFVRRQEAGMNPWGEGAQTLEWHLPSPPPHHAWQKLPRVS